MDPVSLVNFWAGVIAFAILVYVLLDGYDLGVGILFGTTASEQHRVTMMNAIAPYWDGNETWLVLVAAALFAAFPMVYAIFLPAFYLPVALMLLGLIFRGVAFEFRHRSAAMRPVWDLGFFLGSLIAAFVQGAAIGTMVQEVTVVDGRYAGGPFEWVTPFSMLCGVGLVLGYALLGAAWLVLKTEGDLRDWAYRRLTWLVPGVAVVLIAVFAFALTTHLRVLDRWRDEPRLVGAAAAWLDGHDRSVARDAAAARRRAVRNGEPRRCLCLLDARRQLLALHDPILGHGAAGGRSDPVPGVPILGCGNRRVSGRADLHRARLLDLSRQDGQGRLVATSLCLLWVRVGPRAQSRHVACAPSSASALGRASSSYCPLPFAAFATCFEGRVLPPKSFSKPSLKSLFDHPFRPKNKPIVFSQCFCIPPCKPHDCIATLEGTASSCRPLFPTPERAPTLPTCLAVPVPFRGVMDSARIRSRSKYCRCY